MYSVSGAPHITQIPALRSMRRRARHPCCNHRRAAPCLPTPVTICTAFQDCQAVPAGRPGNAHASEPMADKCCGGGQSTLDSHDARLLVRVQRAGPGRAQAEHGRSDGRCDDERGTGRVLQASARVATPHTRSPWPHAAGRAAPASSQMERQSSARTRRAFDGWLVNRESTSGLRGC